MTKKIAMLMLILIMVPQNTNANIHQKCGSYEFEVHREGNFTCLACQPCPHGFGLSIPCGSVVNNKQLIDCVPCENGTFSDSHSFQSCKPCKKCKDNEHMVRNCTSDSDTICYPCKKGFYLSKEKSTCLPCWRCCNNEKDVKIDECMTKGSSYHCSFESSKYCPYGNLTLNLNKSSSGSYQTSNSSVLTSVKPAITSQGGFKQTGTDVVTFAVVILGLALSFVLVSVIICFVRFSRKKKKNIDHSMDLLVMNKEIVKRETSKKTLRCTGCFPGILSKTNCLPLKYISDENDQSDELDDFAKYFECSDLYVFKCDAFIRHDKTSTIDGARNLIVEVLGDGCNSHHKTIEPGYMFISPIFKFYSHGTEFEKPVEICLPHNALIDSGAKNWDVKVLCIDEREKHKSKWKESESEVNIEWDNIKFYTKTLLTYAVVGKPITTAKKRMQFALFSMQKMISDRLEMTLYLLDESKSCLDRITKENKKKGWEMLGCLQPVFIDFCNLVDIIINIEQLVEQWSLVHLKDEVISSQLLRDSYFNIPSVHAVFRRCERRATIFNCHFRVAIGGSEIIIPAVTFVPEELMCMFVDVHNEDPSLSERQTLLSEVPYDIMYQMCRKLDIPARGRGQWRDVGRHFGVSEADLQSCCKEYASIDGSPSKALMEFIFSQRPKLTVGEFIKFLEEHGRGDVVSVLSKVKY